VGIAGAPQQSDPRGGNSQNPFASATECWRGAVDKIEDVSVSFERSVRRGSSPTATYLPGTNFNLRPSGESPDRSRGDNRDGPQAVMIRCLSFHAAPPTPPRPNRMQYRLDASQRDRYAYPELSPMRRVFEVEMCTPHPPRNGVSSRPRLGEGEEGKTSSFSKSP